jgi:hypothetical protein
MKPILRELRTSLAALVRVFLNYAEASLTDSAKTQTRPSGMRGNTGVGNQGVAVEVKAERAREARKVLCAFAGAFLHGVESFLLRGLVEGVYDGALGRLADMERDKSFDDTITNLARWLGDNGSQPESVDEPQPADATLEQPLSNGLPLAINVPEAMEATSRAQKDLSLIDPDISAEQIDEGVDALEAFISAEGGAVTRGSDQYTGDADAIVAPEGADQVVLPSAVDDYSAALDPVMAQAKEQDSAPSSSARNSTPSDIVDPYQTHTEEIAATSSAIGSLPAIDPPDVARQTVPPLGEPDSRPVDPAGTIGSLAPRLDIELKASTTTPSTLSNGLAAVTTNLEDGSTASVTGEADALMAGSSFILPSSATGDAEIGDAPVKSGADELDELAAARAAAANDPISSPIAQAMEEVQARAEQPTASSGSETPDAVPSAAASVVDDELEQLPNTGTVASAVGGTKSSKGKKKKKKGKR